MSGKVRLLSLGILLALLFLPGILATKGPNVVYLKATFRDSIADKIRSDGKGSYQNASNLTVIFNDNAELEFVIGPRAGRSVNFIFDTLLGPGPCAACVGESVPDTVSAEPITYASFRTTISPYHMGPQLNFLEMQPGTTTQVRLGIYFETKARKYFYPKYFHPLYPEEVCQSGAVVNVQALDMDKDGTVDRWVLYPAAEAGDRCLLFRKYTRHGWDFQECSFGNFQMPFMLTLDLS